MLLESRAALIGGVSASLDIVTQTVVVVRKDILSLLMEPVKVCFGYPIDSIHQILSLLLSHLVVKLILLTMKRVERSNENLGTEMI